MVTHVLFAQARENEMKYFEGHPQYRQILSRCGTKHLSESLNKVCQDLCCKLPLHLHCLNFSYF